ncbi:MAG TPA: nuclear transport factor 2 family protein [Candidatus Udaeobacter sp.]|jgi:ketosteroid isomerase-like protein|nr:nuclear transport factor 2 family protein [Candidatus Udaeobacter sp.]
MKKSLRSFLVIIIILLAATSYAPAQDNSAIETKLKQMEDAWEKAFMNKDQAAVGNMVADDYAGINSKGEHQNKTQLLDEIKTSTDTLTASTNDSMEVHVYGPSVATVVGTSTEKGKDKDGKQFSRSFGWVDTWMERNGKWECIGEAVMQLKKK